MSSDNFLVKKHLKFILKCLKILPSAYAGFQNSRPTALFFLISGLDILNKLDSQLTQDSKQEIIDWIYSLQIDSKSVLSAEYYGFRGSSVNSAVIKSNELGNFVFTYESAHITQTYTALCCLLILGDDLSQVDTVAILSGLKHCQKEDGSFCAFGCKNSENDMRFVFCAVAICFILNDFTCINVQKIKDFIRRSVNYDGGIGQAPFCESHGGSTYCALASLSMLASLWDYSVLTSKQIDSLKKWAVFKQYEGFHGRTNKPDDSCYSFWIGASLSMLNAKYMVDESHIRKFLMRTQDDLIGGFSKYEDSNSDILHTYFSIAALSIFNEPFLNPIFPPLNISQRSYQHLLKIRSNIQI